MLFWTPFRFTACRCPPLSAALFLTPVSISSRCAGSALVAAAGFYSAVEGTPLLLISDGRMPAFPEQLDSYTDVAFVIIARDCGSSLWWALRTWRRCFRCAACLHRFQCRLWEVRSLATIIFGVVFCQAGRCHFSLGRSSVFIAQSVLLDDLQHVLCVLGLRRRAACFVWVRAPRLQGPPPTRQCFPDPNFACAISGHDEEPQRGRRQFMETTDLVV